MKLKRLMTIGLATICLTAALGTSAFAHRNIKTYYYKISGRSSQDTVAVAKCHDGNAAYGKYRCVFDKSNADTYMVMNTTLENSNHQSRGYAAVTEGQDITVKNDGKANYLYHLNLVRPDIWAFEATVEGSWSPDEKH